VTPFVLTKKDDVFTVANALGGSVGTLYQHIVHRRGKRPRTFIWWGAKDEQGRILCWRFGGNSSLNNPVLLKRSGDWATSVHWKHAARLAPDGVKLPL